MSPAEAARLVREAKYHRRHMAQALKGAKARAARWEQDCARLQQEYATQVADACAKAQRGLRVSVPRPSQALRVAVIADAIAEEVLNAAELLYAQARDGVTQAALRHRRIVQSAN